MAEPWWEEAIRAGTLVEPAAISAPKAQGIGALVAPQQAQAQAQPSVRGSFPPNAGIFDIIGAQRASSKPLRLGESPAQPMLLTPEQAEKIGFPRGSVLSVNPYSGKVTVLQHGKDVLESRSKIVKERNELAHTWREELHKGAGKFYVDSKRALDSVIDTGDRIYVDSIAQNSLRRQVIAALEGGKISDSDVQQIGGGDTAKGFLAQTKERLTSRSAMDRVQVDMLIALVKAAYNSTGKNLQDHNDFFASMAEREGINPANVLPHGRVIPSADEYEASRLKAMKKPAVPKSAAPPPVTPVPQGAPTESLDDRIKRLFSGAKK